MAKLEFTKQGDLYVAEVTVNNDYNVHIEREKRRISVFGAA